MVPKCRVESLPGAPKCRKAEMCLLENIRVSAELCSGMSDGAVGRKVRANELKMYIKYNDFQQKHSKQNQMAKMSFFSRVSQDANPVSLLGAMVSIC